MVRNLAAIAGVLLGGALVGIAAPAAAQEEPLGFKRVTLDHVEAKPSILHGLVRIRLFVNAIDLETQGSVLPVTGDRGWEIEGNPAIKQIPYLTGVYAGADVETAIVFVIETAYDEATLTSFKDAIKEEIFAPLKMMPHLQVGIVGYGSEVTDAKLTKLETAAGQLEAFVSEGEVVDNPELMQALDRAVQRLRKAKPTVEGTAPSAMRRLIVLVSDGRAEDNDDRDAVIQVARQADKHGIRINTIAYSKEDIRRPLLALGELSKTSHGTFRWIQTKIDESSMRLPFKRLLDEILHQYVLTLFVDPEEMPAKISVTATIAGRELSSAAVKVPVQICGEDECKAGQWCTGSRCVNRAREEGRGILGWILIIGGVAVGALIALIGVGFVITKVRDRKPPRPFPTPAGTTAPTPAPDVPAAPPAPIRGPQLYIMSGPQTGQRIALRHGFTIGKAPGSDLSLEHDGFASSNHAQILMDTAGNCSLVDQGSTNGTYINGVRVTQERLFDGMSIRCGSTELRFLTS